MPETMAKTEGLGLSLSLSVSQTLKNTSGVKLTNNHIPTITQQQ